MKEPVMSLKEKNPDNVGFQIDHKY